MRTRSRSRALSQSTLPDASPIVRLWLLRILVPLGGYREFMSVMGFRDEPVAELLGLGEMIEPTSGDFNLKSARTKLRQLHAAAEGSKFTGTVPTCLATNLARLSRLVGLSDTDCRILEFAVLIHTERVLDNTAEWLGNFTSLKMIYTMSVLLDLPEQEVRASLNPQGLLATSGLLSVDRGGSSGLGRKLNLLSDNFADCIYSSDADPVGLLRDTVIPSDPPLLEIADYAHIGEFLEVLRPYLKTSIASGRKGVNVFLHGRPGTGKSQLAKVLAQELGLSLIHI